MKLEVLVRYLVVVAATCCQQAVAVEGAARDEGGGADGASAQTTSARSHQSATDKSQEGAQPEVAGANAGTVDEVKESLGTKSATQESDTIAVTPIKPDSGPRESERAAEMGTAQRLDDIIVTATKRAVSNRDLTQTVDVMTGEKIERDGIHDIAQLIEHAPGVNIVDDDATVGAPPAISIRGVSSSFSTNGTVGLYFDETPLSDVGYSIAVADISPYDLWTVEILKGPVGTLFGGSSLNGAIRYIPQQPVIGEWQARAFTEFRRSEQSEGLSKVWGAAVNAPFGDTTAARLMYERQEHAGSVDNLNPAVRRPDADDKQQRTLRASLTSNPIERLKLGLIYLDQRSHASDNGLSQLDGNPEEDFQKYVGAVPSVADTEISILQSKASWTFDWADLSLAVGGSEKTLLASVDSAAFTLGNPPALAPTIPLIFTDMNAWAKPTFQELRLVSTSGGKWDWTLGVYHYKNRLLLEGESSTGGNVVGATLAGLIDSFGITQNLLAQNGGIESLSFVVSGISGERAAFADVTWRFIPDFELNLGLRLFEFFYDMNYQYRALSCLLAPRNCNPITLVGDRPLDATERGLGPKLGLKWHADDNLMAYLNVARGFRFGGLNLSVPNPQVPTTYQSDTLWNYEIGLRSDWMERTLIADATVFLIRWKDAQYLTSTSDNLSTYTANAGKIKGEGIEGSLIWNTPLAGVSVNTNAIVMRLKTADSFAANTVTSVGPGQDWPRAPRFQAAANVTWTGYLLDHILSAGATVNHRGKAAQGFLPHEKGVEIFGYTTLDVVASLSGSSQAWMPQVVLNFNNLTDVRGSQYRIPAGTPVAPNMVRFCPPRSVSLKLAWDW